MKQNEKRENPLFISAYDESILPELYLRRNGIISVQCTNTLVGETGVEFIMKINHCEGHQKNISLFVHAHMIEYKSHKEFPLQSHICQLLGMNGGVA